MRIIILLFLFGISFNFFGQKKSRPNLYIVIEDKFESNKDLRLSIEQLVKLKTLKKFNTQLFFLGNRILNPEFPENINFRVFTFNDLCNVCEKIVDLKTKDEFSFQINNATNTCRTFSGLDPGSVDKKLNELLKKNKQNLDVLVYKPKNRSSVKFNGIPDILETSSIVNFSINLNAVSEVDAKIGLQVYNDGKWRFLPQEDIKISPDRSFLKSYDLSENSKVCIDYEKIDGCPTTECSNVIQYKYINKVQPVELFLDSKFFDFPTNITKNLPDELFDCGAKFEIMPETDDFYYFILKKQKGIKSIKIKLKNICNVPALKNCPDVYLDLIEDFSFEKSKYPGYQRYKVNKDFFDPGEVDKLTCADLWNYFHDINNQPLREFEVTFSPQLEENSVLNYKQNEETKIKLIFRTCGGH
jgi:hypothetical protein